MTSCPARSDSFHSPLSIAAGRAANEHEEICMNMAPVADQALFFEQIRRAPARLLVLDYDGTISPFSTDRQLALPYPAVPKLLDRIALQCSTRVVVISGRSARDLPGLLGLNPPPEIWGVHGLERLHSDGRYETAFIGERASRALQRAKQSLEHAGLKELSEEKYGALAIHWRGMRASHMEEVQTTSYQVLGPLACEANLLLNEFDGGLEIRVPAANKGDAVRKLLAEIDGETPVAYMGDDATDEDAFQAIQGRGLSILVRAAWRPTAADIWLRPPGELLEFFNEWVRSCGVNCEY
jgi:trehalose 6-phosphate phosphatase